MGYLERSLVRNFENIRHRHLEMPIVFTYLLLVFFWGISVGFSLVFHLLVYGDMILRLLYFELRWCSFVESDSLIPQFATSLITQSQFLILHYSPRTIFPLTLVFVFLHICDFFLFCFYLSTHSSQFVKFSILRIIFFWIFFGKNFTERTFSKIFR